MRSCRTQRAVLGGQKLGGLLFVKWGLTMKPLALGVPGLICQETDLVTDLGASAANILLADLRPAETLLCQRFHS